MRVKLILPALTEAVSPYFRPIKYSLFPPLGLATLAAYLPDDAEIDLQDEHVEKLSLDDDPELVVIQVYITNARRAYELADHYRARGAHVCLGGLHVTSLPEEAAGHADTIFLGPGEDTWPQFLSDYARGRPGSRYIAPSRRDLARLPPIRRDLIKRALYLVPNSIVVTRGCPHKCDFCYKEAFFEGGNSFYVQKVDDALAEIERLPGSRLLLVASDRPWCGDQTGTSSCSPPRGLRSRVEEVRISLELPDPQPTGRPCPPDSGGRPHPVREAFVPKPRQRSRLRAVSTFRETLSRIGKLRESHEHPFSTASKHRSRFMHALGRKRDR